MRRDHRAIEKDDEMITRRRSRELRMRARRTVAVAAIGVTAVAGMAMTAGSASALEFRSFDAAYTDTSGQPERQAGSHPDVRVKFVVPHDPPDEFGNPGKPHEQFHRLRVEMPRGLVGDPTAVEQCPESQMAALFNGNAAQCPAGAQIGYATVPGIGAAPVYNIVPPTGTPGMFAFNIVGVIVKLFPTVRAGDYGITVDTGALSSASPLQSTDLTLWGVPADPSHDHERYAGLPFPSPGAPSQAPRRPFLTLGTSCTGSADAITGHIDGWNDIGRFDTRTITSDFDGLPFTMTGCDRLAFDPSMTVRTATRQPNAASGVEVELLVPQNTSADSTATAHVKDVTVALPVGMSVSPSAANGLAACTDPQVDLGSDRTETCPRASRIGSATVHTPLLSEPLTGNVYVGSQQSDDPQSGKMFRIFLVAASDESGVRIKLEGAVRPNLSNGQLVATFASNPQLPFDALQVRFDGGPGAVLATPPSCDEKHTETTISSWSGKSVSSSSAFSVDCVSGLGAFAPGFTAGTVVPSAGVSSPFTVQVDKPDTHADLNAVALTLPRGLLANLADHMGTRVGTARVAAGPGPQPFWLDGPVVLEGAYGDAPFSLRVTVPAVAGPFDLGEVVVRQRIYVDRNDAHVTVVSDPLPTIVKGVPIRMQKLHVNIDKTSFMVNPTNCEPSSVKGTLGSSAGQSAAVSSRFQVGDCAALPFAPRMGFKVGAKGRTGRDQRTPLVVTLGMSPGQANNRSIEVTLPKALNARLDVIQRDKACTIQQYDADACPNPVGTASAVTPLLRDPLRGSVFLVYNPERRLPDLVARLKGPVPIDLVGRVTITRDFRLQTTFDTIPDVPIKTFRMALESGEGNGPIGITRNLCQKGTRRELEAAIAFKAQSNRTIHRAQQIKVAGCGKAKPKAKASPKAKRGTRASKRAAVSATLTAVQAATKAVAASRAAVGR